MQDENQCAAYDEPAFNPTRLIVARQQRNLTRKALADRVGVSAQAITSFESGSSKPSITTCRHIALGLDFDRAFFYGDDLAEIPVEGITFRSRSCMSASVRYKTLSSSKLAAGLLSPAIRRRFGLPEPSVPDLCDVRPKDAAVSVRNEWELGPGPIMNMVHLLEAKGVEMYWFEEESQFVDAVSFWWDNRPYALVSLRKRGGERARFDVAHELGHLVLHRRCRDLDSKQVESEANQFASEFLLPETQFRLECPAFPMLEDFYQLKPRWQVSVQAMIYRCHDLGLMSDRQYQLAFKEVSARGERRTERGELSFEESEIHSQILERLAARDVYAEDLAREIRLRLDDLTNLMPVAKRYSKKPEDDRSGRLTIEELGYEPSE